MDGKFHHYDDYEFQKVFVQHLSHCNANILDFQRQHQFTTLTSSPAVALEEYDDTPRSTRILQLRRHQITARKVLIFSTEEQDQLEDKELVQANQNGAQQQNLYETCISKSRGPNELSCVVAVSDY